MPRKQFIADVKAAAEGQFPNITTVARGDDDGEVIVTYVPPSSSPIEIALLANPDVSSYPSESNFMAFAKSETVPTKVGDVLAEVVEFSAGMQLPELISVISSKLERALALRLPNSASWEESDEDMRDGNAEASEDEDDEDEDEDEGLFLDEKYHDENPLGDSSATTQSIRNNLTPAEAKARNRRIKSDLLAVKFAGFNVGIVSGMKVDSSNSLFSMSMRVSKLGLSEEALNAWDMEPQQYLVLLVKYNGPYKAFEDVIRDATKPHEISFRIGLCNRYKPTHEEAHAAFTEIIKKSRNFNPSETEASHHEGAGFVNLFISSSLNEFINTQFIALMKIRNSTAVGWDEAKIFLDDKQGYYGISSVGFAPVAKKFPSERDDGLPEAIANDHLSESEGNQVSFPLVAAQFAWRYFIRCNDYCLVCHDKIADEFEALKPYVCAKPLCLYQYMSLGFGPSVEHEILTQPYVVDLLVSFCYSSAQHRSLREYPIGMSLAVPGVISVQTTEPRATYSVGNITYHPPKVTETPIEQLDVEYDSSRLEITFKASASGPPVRNGDWVVVVPQDRSPIHHRIEDTSLYPIVSVSDATTTSVDSKSSPGILSAIPATPVPTPPPTHITPAKLRIYNQNFDDMGDLYKAETIVAILDTLPSIRELQAFLMHQVRFSEPNLKVWKERISPAALGILRWIIASNRSCIVQVDKCPDQDTVGIKAKTRPEQRVANISKNWVQFRFAQGSPDKEQRFLNALKEQQSKLDPKYPTLFAWHGSPLQNWHSIIRSGLDFKQIAHGRAYGHGVYHAMDQQTSMGYCPPHAVVWRSSSLNIVSAMSLNEIVNCPGDFNSSRPYLVIQHIDWIQCRYLFVQVRGDTSITDRNNLRHTDTEPDEENEPGVKVEQDPNFKALSTTGMMIGVPACAVTVSRGFRIKTKPESSTKRRKQTSESPCESSSLLSDGESISDIDALFSEDDEPLAVQSNARSFMGTSNKENAKPLTDFVPKSLDQSCLPMLEPPSYATPMATKTLNRQLKELLDFQEKTPLHELGWYLNPDLINNIYQWIVELHSFDPELPLAKDMKVAGMTSIVVEIRFGKDYPFSPPFLRIIRPRFLPFAAGGGGHVTAGGAMCMELLTNTGWSSASTIESVLLQVRMAIMSMDPKPARLERASKFSQHDYTTGEAIEAYIRACQSHGWQIPPDFVNAFGVGGRGY